MKWLKRGLIALVGVALAAAIAYVIWPKPVPVDSARLQRGALRVTLDEDGRTRLRRRELVSAPVAGELEHVELRPGDRVQRGQEVARLGSPEPALLDARTRLSAEHRVEAAKDFLAQARVAERQAQRALTFAESEHQRSQQLLLMGALSEQQMESTDLELNARRQALASATAAVQIAAHDLDAARAILGDGGGASSGLRLVATADGVVLRVLREEAGTVAAGTPLVELGDPTSLEIVVSVLTADAVRVGPGARAWVDAWGGDGPLAARVERVEPAAFTRLSALGVEEQRVNLVLALDGPPERWSMLGDGFRVEAHVVVWQGDNVLAVPASALFRSRDEWAVYVIEDGRAVLRTLTIGHVAALASEVKSGLGAGDVVVVHPGERVHDGVRITVREH